MNWLVLLLSCALCGMTIAFGLTVRRLREQERSMEEAAHRIAEYILDQRKGGIECNEEGAMYHLFHEVNSLVTIADAHADSERQAKEFLRDTISDISHQLKTPIAALNIYNGILQQEAADTATVQEFTALSEQELDRIESLVQSLLKMARLDAGAITLEQSPENLSELLEHIRGQYSFRAEQEGKEIDLEGDEQAILLCDRTWLTEAIGNLVKNALDHTEQGDRILVRWQQSPCLTQITVEDTGSGIHPEDLYHIFKRFYRSRFSKDTQGIGLGLPLAKSIIEAHRGSIEVHSEIMAGTTFIINFPIQMG
jgi:signal transduction histidine kinase